MSLVNITGEQKSRNNSMRKMIQVYRTTPKTSEDHPGENKKSHIKTCVKIQRIDSKKKKKNKAV